MHNVDSLTILITKHYCKQKLTFIRYVDVTYAYLTYATKAISKKIVNSLEINIHFLTSQKKDSTSYKLATMRDSI